MLNLSFRSLSHRVLSMNGQSKISAFFSQSSMKRSSTSDEVVLNPSSKRPCPDQENQPVSNITSSEIQDVVKDAVQDEIKPEKTPLSPEQKKRMEENRAAAQAKLNAHRNGGLLVNVGNSWYKALEPEFSKPYFTELSKFVETERSKRTIYPPANDVFCWTNYCNINDVKVIILGQDPYHGPKQAHGLCFSVQKGISPPPSLENMFKELTNDIPGFKHPGHGTLIGWAEQGVLLLNACLTVRAGQANSHKDKGWEKLTDAVISWLNKNKSGLVFMLWGAYAQKKGGFIDKKKHHVLKGVHPSPLSAHKGYFGCKHFSQCNDLLKKEGRKPIDWTHLPPQD